MFNPFLAESSAVISQSWRVGTGGKDLVKADPVKKSPEANLLSEEVPNIADLSNFLSSWDV